MEVVDLLIYTVSHQGSSSRSALTMPSEIYEVEKILDYRFRRGLIEYKIKWKNYPVEESTWEPEENLTDCTETVRKFKASRGLEEEEESQEPVISSPKVRRMREEDYEQLEQAVDEDSPFNQKSPEEEDQMPFMPKFQQKASPSPRKIPTIRKSNRPLERSQSPKPINFFGNRDPETEWCQPNADYLVRSPEQPDAAAEPTSFQILAMMADGDKNYYFEVKRGPRKDTLSRSEVLTTDVRALIDFYEKRIHFKKPLVR